MKEIYITAVPLAPVSEKVIYEPKNYENGSNIQTSFPIVPIINNNIGKPEEKILIAVRMKNKDTDRNIDVLRDELNALTGNQDHITVKDVSIPEDQREVVNGIFLLHLMDEIEDDSLVYAYITYGSKILSTMIVFALLMIEKMKDAEVKGIYYGEVVREEGTPLAYYSYDMTGLMKMSGAIEGLEILGISDKRRMIERLFGYEVTNDTE